MTRHRIGLLAGVGLALWLVACGSAPGVPVLPVVDAVGRTVARVAGWCEDQGVTPDRVREARERAERGDYLLALEALDVALSAARAAGKEVPEDVEVMLRLARELAAVQGLQDGLRALHDPARHFPPEGDAGAPP